MTASRIPDSDLARKATRYVEELSAPFLYRHVVRTFLLGDAVGRRQGSKYDVELLYLAAVLHDLGLTGKLDSTERFEVAGADAAKAYVTAAGLPDDKAEVLWDAIALHTTLGVATRKRPEVALVAVGAAMDVVGQGVDRLDPAVVERIMTEYPRDGFEEDIVDTLAAVARKNPQAAALTFVAEVGRSQVPDLRCPTFVELLRASPLRKHAESA